MAIHSRRIQTPVALLRRAGTSTSARPKASRGDCDVFYVPCAPSRFGCASGVARGLVFDGTGTLASCFRLPWDSASPWCSYWQTPRQIAVVMVQT
eukprot:scaffold2808_cov255-Pinguiococcus_pyrenoidosus.AAC.30